MLMDIQSSTTVLEASLPIYGYLFLLVAIMIASGLLGGAAHHVLAIREHSPGSPHRKAWKSPLLGIVVALTVPFLLRIFSSNLLETARENPLNLLVFSGICIIASFIVCWCTTRNRRQAQLSNNAKTTATATPAAPPNTPASTPKSLSPEKALTCNMSDIEHTIMKMIDENNDFDQGLTAFYENTDIPQELFNETLSLMMVKGLVGQQLTHAGKLKFKLTQKGKQLLSKVTET